MNRPDTKSPVDSAIEAMAAAWLAERDDGLTAEETAEFARWREADPRHAAAVARLEETWGLLAGLSQLQLDQPARPDRDLLARRQPQKVIRFPGLKIAAMAAAGLALAAGVWWMRPHRDGFDHAYATTSGGFERVSLPDGSVIELNASSEVRVRFSGEERHVDLTGGEAHFKIAKDPARPFIVAAGRVAVRAVGTAFNVRMRAAEIEVLVTEGRVQLNRAPAGNAPAAAESWKEPQMLAAGQRAVVSASAAAIPTVEPVAPAEIRRTLDWEEPRLVFVETPLAEVVDQFNRHNQVQLVLGDPDLSSLPVGGSFRAENVDAFVRLLESSHDVSAERQDGRIVLRKAR